MFANFLIIIVTDVAIRIIHRTSNFFRPEMQTDTSSHVDEGFQSFASVEIVTVVDKERNFLERGSVQTVTETETDNVVLIESDTIDENTGPAHVLANKKAIFINEVVGNFLVLLFLCRKGTQTAKSSDA